MPDRILTLDEDLTRLLAEELESLLRVIPPGRPIDDQRRSRISSLLDELREQGVGGRMTAVKTR